MICSTIFKKKTKVHRQHICTGDDFHVNLKYQYQLNYFLALSVEYTNISEFHLPWYLF